MSQVYEGEGVLEGDRVIRLKKPISCPEGPVRATVTRETGTTELRGPNRGALQALDRFLGEPDDLTPQQWAELEKVIEEHSLKIRTRAAS